MAMPLKFQIENAFRVSEHQDHNPEVSVRNRNEWKVTCARCGAEWNVFSAIGKVDKYVFDLTLAGNGRCFGIKRDEFGNNLMEAEHYGSDAYQCDNQYVDPYLDPYPNNGQYDDTMEY